MLGANGEGDRSQETGVQELQEMKRAADVLSSAWLAVFVSIRVLDI